MSENSKTESQRDKLNRLYNEFGLLKEDVHQHQHYTIIRRTGIEKIAAKAGIRLSYKLVKVQPDFAVVKATGKMGKAAAAVTAETYGSAGKDTSQNKYYVEMAEKRAKSRCVLQLTDLYALGVYGEDEADDFHRNNNPAPVAQPASPAPMKAVASEQPEPAPMPLNANFKKPATPLPAHVGQKPSMPAIDDEQVAPAAERYAHLSDPEGPCNADQKQELIALVNHPYVYRNEKTKMLLNINKITVARANQAIDALRATIPTRVVEHEEAERLARKLADDNCDLLVEQGGEAEYDRWINMILNPKASIDDLKDIRKNLAAQLEKIAA